MEKIDFKKQANPREQILGLLVIVALFVMFFRILYLPKKESVDQMKTQIQSIKLEKEALDKFTGALLKVAPQREEKLKTEKQAFKDQILKGERPPAAKEAPGLLEVITAHKFLKGISIKSMSHLPPKRENHYEKSEFFINAQGTFRNMTSYIERIENIPALLTIETLSLKALDPKATQVEMDLNGALFQLEEKNVEPKS